MNENTNSTMSHGRDGDMVSLLQHQGGQSSHDQLSISRSTAIALIQQQRRQRLSATTTTPIKDFTSLVVPTHYGRELLDNSWYWFCDTFNGPVCATCQQLPNGYDPCMVRHLGNPGRDRSSVTTEDR